MINNKDFANRLKKVIDYYGESASSFAEKISVQRSSISHILSGRNKPSLDFVLKILTTYPEVDLYWLLNGKGSFPSQQSTLNFNDTNTQQVPPPKNEDATPKAPLPLQEALHHNTDNAKAIERIVIFYTDGSFKNFQN